MRRGTTPDFLLTVPGRDLTDKTVLVTIIGGGILKLTGTRLSVTYDESDSHILFRLTQEETFKLQEGEAYIQVRFIDSEGLADATDSGTITVKKVLIDEVITYEGG